MSKGITTGSGLTIGLDLGDRFTEGRVLDETGEVVQLPQAAWATPLSAQSVGRHDTFSR